jgi:hypothetical protein
MGGKCVMQEGTDKYFQNISRKSKGKRLVGGQAEIGRYS